MFTYGSPIFLLFFFLSFIVSAASWPITFLVCSHIVQDTVLNMIRWTNVVPYLINTAVALQSLVQDFEIVLYNICC